MSQSHRKGSRATTSAEEQAAVGLLQMILKLPPRILILLVIIVLLVVGCGAVAFFGYSLMQSSASAVKPPPNTSSSAASSAPASSGSPSSSVAGSTWYKVYFTTPKYPDNKADHHGSVDDRLTEFINTAQTSVDMAIYQLDLENVTQAMLNAKKRGATVRVVTDQNILDDPKENPSLKEFQKAGIPVVGGNPNAIMHDKFVVVDKKAVWSGTWNFTENDTFRYNNVGIAMQSPELAKNYTVAFEKRFIDKKFGAQAKPGGTTSKLTIGGINVENYFASEDDVQSAIVARLKSATKTIDFMAFSFTDDLMGDTIIARAQAGVKVRGVFENTGSETQYSEYGKMLKAKLDVLQDGNPYLMHLKVFIIDSKTVIVGSFNFSENAQKSNDENLLIFDDPSMAQQFQPEFGRVYEQAKNPPNKK
jgi:phosphatidylserine/phosphatidylglycerophosphate/cardiolipin synthase-like enzyme